MLCWCGNVIDCMMLLEDLIYYFLRGPKSRLSTIIPTTFISCWMDEIIGFAIILCFLTYRMIFA